MKITDLLKAEGICLGANPASRDEAVDLLVSLHEKTGSISDAAVYRADILAREEKGSTAVGMGIAVPHAKSAAVLAPALAAMTVPDGVDYKSMDKQPSKLFFMIAAPKEGADTHLEILAKLMGMLMDPAFSDSLIKADTPETFLRLIDEKEAAKDAEEAAKKAAKEKAAAEKAAAEAAAAAAAATTAAVAEDTKEPLYRFVAVTACPTGIAHTYMAAEALENEAKKRGVSIKVETDGSGGVKNALSKQEIAEAEAVLLAVDKNVEMARFQGKKVFQGSTSDAIHKAADVLDKAESGNLPIYQHSGEISTKEEESKEGFGRTFYKHLMNGVSHMLPFVIGGGILIAIAFLLDDYSINPANFGSNTPVAAWFKAIGGVAFNFMLPILAGFIAMSIADRPGLAIGFVGGALAASGATFVNPGGDVPSAFLGAMAAGFIGGYLVQWLKKAFSKLPAALEGIKPVLLYPLCGVLLIGIVMCAINPIVGALNSWITGVLNSMGSGSSIVLGLLVAGMMAVDMGGPLNKAAYVFGTAALSAQTEQGYMIMAAVMIGGMVPPIAIAIATIVFKNKFTEAERKSGPVNFVMGLCFITEGAIPFAAADPLHVIPSCIIGSAVSGALAMAFKCTLMAPHGGIFVFPVVGHWPLYLLALLIGSVIGAFLLGLLKKRVTE